MKYFSLFSLCLVISCAHVPPKQPTGLTPVQVFKDQGLRESRLREISAKIHLDYRGPVDKVAGGGRVVMLENGRFRLEARDPLGRLRYVLTQNKNQLSAYYPVEGRAYLDKDFGAHYLRRMLGVSQSFSEVQSLFLGILPERWRKHKFQNWGWQAKNGVYQGTISLGKEKVVCDVDPDSGAFVSLDFQIDGKPDMQVAYSDSRSMEEQGKHFNFYQVVKVSKGDSSLELEWQSIDNTVVRPDNNAFSTEFPAGTRKIVMDH